MGPTGGTGQGSTTPVSLGTTGLAPSQAHELVNGEKNLTTFWHKIIYTSDKNIYFIISCFLRSKENSVHSGNSGRNKFTKCCGCCGQVWIKINLSIKFCVFCKQEI